MKTKNNGIIILAGFAILLAGCASTPPTRFYTLSAESSAISQADRAASRTVIGVGPIEVAPYLERNQIVVRTGNNNLSLADFDQWAEPIETNISNTLAANLANLLPATQPVVRPWSDANAGYNVVLKITRFDSDVQGEVRLEADWGIQQEGSQSMPVIRESSIRQPGTGTDYMSIAGSMSAALAQLSEEIAAELKTLIQHK